jgi:hypothetical protein
MASVTIEHIPINPDRPIGRAVKVSVTDNIHVRTAWLKLHLELSNVTILSKDFQSAIF